jgi:hypothetical protein
VRRSWQRIVHVMGGWLLTFSAIERVVAHKKFR